LSLSSLFESQQALGMMEPQQNPPSSSSVSSLVVLVVRRPNQGQAQ